MKFFSCQIFFSRLKNNNEEKIKKYEEKLWIRTGKWGVKVGSKNFLSMFP